MNKKSSKTKRWFHWKLPSEQELKQHKYLRFLSHRLHDAHLWHFDRYSVPKACLIGIYMSLMPMPFQMIPAAVLAVLFRANLILSVALVWISNPLTMPFMLFGCYHIGKWILNSQSPELASYSLGYLLDQLQLIWAPMLLGCIVAGLFFGILGYIITKVIWTFIDKRRHAKHTANRNHP